MTRCTAAATTSTTGGLARIEEAILWHGGEAAGARDRYAASSEDDRQALLTFLRAL